MGLWNLPLTNTSMLLQFSLSDVFVFFLFQNLSCSKQGNFFLFQNLANRSLVDDTLRKVNGLKPIASELGVSLAQLAIAWCASNPNVSSVITGATKENQVLSTRPRASQDMFLLPSKTPINGFSETKNTNPSFGN